MGLPVQKLSPPGMRGDQFDIYTHDDPATCNASALGLCVATTCRRSVACGEKLHEAVMNSWIIPVSLSPVAVTVVRPSIVPRGWGCPGPAESTAVWSQTDTLPTDIDLTRITAAHNRRGFASAPWKPSP